MRVWSKNVAVAEELRTRALQVVPPFSPEALLASACPGAVVVGCDLPDGVDELVAVTPDGVLVLHRADADRRLACAHAIAHLVLDVDDGHLRPGPMLDPEREARADDLALELLAPDRLLLERVIFWPTGSADIYEQQLDSIAAHFGVPRASIDSRIRHLERTTEL